ncbi:aminoacyl-tRNA hydrolase [Lachnospiraceae bacterium]|nr:aminoacyl-tRNA hydrolase [Lachnospiraceae bacterium]
MYIIAGLGNPGTEYEHTRHNAGFQAVDCLAERMNTELREKKFFALCGKTVFCGERVLLMKPQTYMNRSGESLRAAADFFRVEADHIIVISDDINLEEGQLRIRLKGSAGGHNGLKSVISQLGSQEFRRIRVGVGAKPENWDLADYVLGAFKGDDRERMEEAYRNAAEAACLMITDGEEKAMNRYNRRMEKA